MDSQNNSPLSLKFHNFYCRVYLPFIIFMGCLNLLAYFTYAASWNTYTSTEKVMLFFSLAYDISCIYLGYLVASDLSKLNYDGYKSNKLLLCLFCLNSFMKALFSETFATDFAATCGIAFIALLINNYYNKREHLFIRDETENDVSTGTIVSQLTDNPSSEPSAEQTDKVKIIIKRKPIK